VDRNQVKTAIL